MKGLHNKVRYLICCLSIHHADLERRAGSRRLLFEGRSATNTRDGRDYRRRPWADSKMQQQGRPAVSRRLWRPEALYT